MLISGVSILAFLTTLPGKIMGGIKWLFTTKAGRIVLIIATIGLAYRFGKGEGAEEQREDDAKKDQQTAKDLRNAVDDALNDADDVSPWDRLQRPKAKTDGGD